MKLLLIIATFASLRSILANSDCIGTCYSGDIYPNAKNIHPGKHLQGVSYKNITTDDQGKCYRHCVEDCRCKACQIKGTRCELLDEHKEHATTLLDTDAAYTYLNIQQTMFKGKSHMLQPGVCYNGCCKSQPCLNGGTCVEHCESTRKKFTCECYSLFYGVVCEKKIAVSSCPEAIKKLPATLKPPRGIYNNNSSNSFYCDFEMQPRKRAWTLIKSFSSKHQSSSENNPLNWPSYKVDYQLYGIIQKRSTLFRVTCDFPLRTTLVPDFFLAEYKELIETQTWACKKFIHININGKNFYNGTARVQFEGKNLEAILYIDGCQSSCTLKLAECEGHKRAQQRKTTCHRASESTTQYWLGEEI